MENFLELDVKYDEQNIYYPVPIADDPNLMDRILLENVHPNPYVASLILKCPDLKEILDENPFVDLPNLFIPENLPKEINPVFRERGKAYQQHKKREENLFQTINWISSLENEYIIAKGHIQSGKTNFMMCLSNLLVSIGFNVVIILRNNDADRRQFEEHFKTFQEEHNSQYEKKHLLIKANSKKMNDEKDDAKIFLILGNEINLNKVATSLEKSVRKYVVFIDEVDAIDCGGISKKSAALSFVKENAYCVFGISGTIMDAIAKEKVNIKNLITLKTPIDYKGIFNGKIFLQSRVTEHFQLDEKKNSFSGRIDDDLFENVQIESFIREYTKFSPFETISTYHPRVCLINVSKCVEPYMKAQKKISILFPNILTLVYTGDGITRRLGIHTFSYGKRSISEVLQDIKEKFPEIRHILIFAGELAGRGISFVSTDRTLHLTDEFLIVANSTDEPEIIQKIRLCGRYSDNLPLTLFSTKKVISDLRRAYFRQEEIIKCIKGSNREFCKSAVEEMSISKTKMTNRSITKDEKAKVGFNISNGTDNGLSMDVYNGKKNLPDEYFEMYKTNISQEDRKSYEENIQEEIDDEDKKDEEEDEEEDKKENERLINTMFPRWEVADSNIAKFMHHVDPDKLYTETEIKKLCREYNITFSELLRHKRGKSKAYGKIFEKKDGGFRIRSELVESFKEHF